MRPRFFRRPSGFCFTSPGLPAAQKMQLTALRAELPGDQPHPAGVYLYSQAVSMPEIPNTDFLFK